MILKSMDDLTAATLYSEKLEFENYYELVKSVPILIESDYVTVSVMRMSHILWTWNITIKKRPIQIIDNGVTMLTDHRYTMETRPETESHQQWLRAFLTHPSGYNTKRLRGLEILKKDTNGNS